MDISSNSFLHFSSKRVLKFENSNVEGDLSGTSFERAYDYLLCDPRLFIFIKQLMRKRLYKYWTINKYRSVLFCLLATKTCQCLTIPKFQSLAIKKFTMSDGFQCLLLLMVNVISSLTVAVNLKNGYHWNDNFMLFGVTYPSTTFPISILGLWLPLGWCWRPCKSKFDLSELFCF